LLLLLLLSSLQLRNEIGLVLFFFRCTSISLEFSKACSCVIGLGSGGLVCIVYIIVAPSRGGWLYFG
jgi:hypothetical protein